MKSAIFIGALLVLSIFAGAIAFAKEGSDDFDDEADDSDSASLTSSDVSESVGLDDDDIEEDINANADVPANWRSFPAVVTQGLGHAVEGKNGYFARIALVEKDFANPATDSNTVTTVIHGRLKIGNKNFKLVSRQENVNADANADSMTFEVVKNGDNVGTFTLRTTASFEGNNFKLRTGTLTLDSGKVYEVSLATETKAVRKATLRDKTLQVARGNDVDDESDDSDDSSDDSTNKGKRARWWAFWENRKDRSGSNSGEN